jgi:hypothetical protein
MKDDLISKVEHSVRAEQKWSDGVPQIAAGIFIIICMGMMLDDKGNLFVVFVPIIPIVIEGLRKRFTYPRVGKAVLREKTSQRVTMLTIVAAFLIAGAVGFFLVKGKQAGGQMWTWSVIAIAVLAVALMLYRSWREYNKRMLWYAVFIALLATGIVLFKPHRHEVEYIMLGFGTLNLIYGVITLVRFVRKYPVLQDAE